MRQFKNNYTGEIVTELKNGDYFLNSNIIIPSRFIENSKDWVEIFEPKLKNGDVVKLKKAIVLITDYEKGEGYGVFFGVWFINNWLFKELEWQLATQEEWLEALTKEAEKKYKVGDEVKRPDSFCNNGVVKIDKHISSIGFINNKLNMFQFYGHQVMQDGIWADVAKEETIEDLAERFYNRYGFSPLDFKTFFTENKETINRLSK